MTKKPTAQHGAHRPLRLINESLLNKMRNIFGGECWLHRVDPLVDIDHDQRPVLQTNNLWEMIRRIRSERMDKMSQNEGSYTRRDENG